MLDLPAIINLVAALKFGKIMIKKLSLLLAFFLIVSHIALAELVMYNTKTHKYTACLVNG